MVPPKFSVDVAGVGEDGELSLLRRLHPLPATAETIASATTNRRADPRCARVDVTMPFIVRHRMR
jgi:hypothetical protein